MQSKRIAIGALVAGACVLIGALGGIASGSAASKKSSTRTHAAAQTQPGPGHPGFGGPGGPSIHSVSVQLNQAGTGYVTVTSDSGKLQSVDTSASTVTLVEGLSSNPYKTVTLSVPSGATVSLDGKTSSLGALAAGDHVVVSSSSDGTSTVFATDSSFTPPMGHGGPGGPGPAGAPGDGGPWGSSTSTTTTTSSTSSSS
jgi:hypothetical protein